MVVWAQCPLLNKEGIFHGGQCVHALRVCSTPAHLSLQGLHRANRSAEPSHVQALSSQGKIRGGLTRSTQVQQTQAVGRRPEESQVVRPPRLIRSHEISPANDLHGLGPNSSDTTMLDAYFEGD